MTITVHHLQVSQSERIVWLCEELGLQYDLKLHQRDPLLSPPAIKQMNPLGAAPILEDDSFGENIMLAESGAICEWLIFKHGDGKLALPPSHPDYANYLYWWHTSNGTIQPAMSRLLAVSQVKSADPDNQVLKRYQGRFELLLKHVDERLRKSPYLAGEEFTAADIMSMFSFSTVRVFFPVSLKGYDGILAWLKRCAERPAYQRSRQKGDPETGPYIDAEAPPLFPAIAALRG